MYKSILIVRMTHTKKEMSQRLLKGHEAVLLKQISEENFSFFLSIFHFEDQRT